MGLTRDGYTADSYETIVARITARLIAYDPNIDLSVESIEGQFLRIYGFEASLLQSEQKTTHYSYSPLIANGLGLQHLGLISGIEYGVAERSATFVNLTGTAGTSVPRGSIVSDALDNEFITVLAATVGGNVQVIAKNAGAIAMPIGTIVNVVTAIPGWTGVTQTAAGTVGSSAQTEEAFRNLRNKTVLRNYTSVAAVTEARIRELGIPQVTVADNHTIAPLADGTPVGNIHVTVGEVGTVTDAQIARTILATLNTGTPTFGTTSVVVQDSQGVNVTINFDKAVAVNIEMTVNLTYLSDDTAGADEGIQTDIAAKVNALLAGGDIIHSHYYGIITGYAEAQVDSFLIGEVGQANQTAANFVIAEGEFAVIDPTDITIA